MSGRKRGTSGSQARRARYVSLLIFAAVGLAFAVVNAISEIDERERMGRPIDGWEPWAWEFSSLAGFLLIAPVIIFLSQRLRPPVMSWPAALTLALLASVPASLAHVAIMTGLREAVYAAGGGDYRNAAPLADVLLYEYRKDLITFAVLVLLPHLAARLIDRAPAEDRPDYRLEVRDGSRTRWLAPADIEWAQAAGNYVELHGAFGMLLHRRTLAALENELALRGFARIHRSRLVRICAIREVRSRPSGDFDVVVASGATLAGSRRFRTNLP